MPDETLNPLILDSVEDTDNNVFLVLNDGSIDAMNLGKIQIKEEDEKIICIEPSGGRIKLTLEGLGDGVNIAL
jgi:hypothetical protein